MSKQDDQKQRTSKGLEIPIPTRGEFIRNLKKTAAKPKPSTPRHRPKK